MKKLNAGCGRKIKEGYVNLDIADLPGIDIKHDLTKFPYPFKNEEFNEILCEEVLEHMIDMESILKEFHRILKKNGTLIIYVPHFTSTTAYKCPDHKRFFSYGTFDHFVNKKIYYTKVKFSSSEKKLLFGKKIALWNYLIEVIANIFPKLYENTPLRVFPALRIRVKLVK